MLGDRLRRGLRSSALVRPLRLARVGRTARNGGHFDWAPVLEKSAGRWAEAGAAAKDGKRILIATDVGLHFGASRFDSLLAVALTLRGAKVDVLLCDGALPACMIGDVSWYPNLDRFVEHGPQADFCRHCHAPASDAWRAIGIEPIRIGDKLTEADHAEASAWAEAFGDDHQRIRADPVADQGLAGALRFYARSNLAGEPEANAVLRRFLRAAWLSHRAASRALESADYAAVVLHHGIYVPQGPVLAAAKAKGVRTVSWNVGYRRRSFIFSHGESYHHTMIAERNDRWESLDLSEAWQSELTRYLHSRRGGERDWIVFGRGTEFNGKAYLERRGLDLARPFTLALTNVAWDAQLHYPSNSFASMGDWLVATVRWFADHPGEQLVLRVHPAELTGSMPARERTSDILGAAFPSLPRNVVLVDADDAISTYALIEECRAAIVYATKAGIEVAAMGKPLIVAGDAWVRGKGFSADASDPAHYLRLLEALPGFEPSPPAIVERARRYAFHYFFRRMLPIAATLPETGWPPFNLSVSALAELEQGADPGLDVACEGILSGSPFEYRAEASAPAGMPS